MLFISFIKSLKCDKLLTLINYEWQEYDYLLCFAFLGKFKNYAE